MEEVWRPSLFVAAALESGLEGGCEAGWHPVVLQTIERESRPWSGYIIERLLILSIKVI